MPGSVHAVRNKTDKTNMNKKLPTNGTTIVNFSDKYGQLYMIYDCTNIIKQKFRKKKNYHIYSKTKNKTEVPINKTNANKNIPTCSEPIQRPQK